MNKDLPVSVREIADVIGREQALRLIGSLPSYFSGAVNKKGYKKQIYIPNRLKITNHMVKVIGWNDALKMVRHFSGTILTPANCQCIIDNQKYHDLKRMIKDGWSIPMIEAALEIRYPYYDDFGCWIMAVFLYVLTKYEAQNENQ